MKSLIIFIWTILFTFSLQGQRPFWVMAHMCNTSDYAKAAIKDGANAIEADVSFKEDGTPDRFFHGTTHRWVKSNWSSNVGGLLNYFGKEAKANSKFSLLLLDLKCGDIENPGKIESNGKTRMFNAGKKMADLVKRNVYQANGSPKLYVIFSIYDDSWKDIHKGVQSVFGSNYPYIGYDVGMQSYHSGNSTAAKRVDNYFKNSFSEKNVWYGDGMSVPLGELTCPNCKELIRHGVQQRNHIQGKIKKVWAWTANTKRWMDNYLDLGVDAICTDNVKDLVKKVNERSNFRLATQADNPFQFYGTKTMTYIATIKTGTSSKAGTDSNIFLTIKGSKGNSEEIRLNEWKSGNIFEKGKSDVITFNAKDVGTVKSISVRSDNRYPGSDWQLSTIKLKKSSKDYFFNFNTWLNSNKKLVHKKPGTPLTNYDIWVTTGNTRGGGTNANIKIWLSGTKGSTHGIIMNPLISGNAFERGKTDHLVIRNIKDIGTVKKVKIYSDGAGVGSDWSCYAIAVKKKGTSKKTFYFKEWINSKETASR